MILRLQDSADFEAWNAFVEVYGPVLVRVARKHGMQAADVDNLVQEVLLSVANSVDQWNARTDRGSFRYWLLRVARNKAINQLTRNGARPKTTSSKVEIDLNELEGSEISNDLELAYQREVFRWAAEQARELVEESTWQAFWLTSVEGMSVLEASKTLGVPVGAIYVSRSRVMHRLKCLVKQFEASQ